MLNNYGSQILVLTTQMVYRGIPFEFKLLYDGYQIKTDTWDVVCHSGSYGHEEGLLEGYGKPFEDKFDDVEGYLTALDVLERIEGV